LDVVCGGIVITVGLSFKYGDLLALTKILCHLFYKLNVISTFAWAKEVFSPFDGVVVKTENKAKDRVNLNLFRDLIVGLVLAPINSENDIRYFLGNYVVLESKKGVLALFAHLRQGSVIVSEGESVTAGELIGQIGNSGNTIQPHLHFQLMKETDLFNAVPIPFVFEAYQISNKGAWESKTSELPSNFKKFRI
jgi:murein DD-endopeptidase MepM/ murein hydrolase activator NlpD